MTLTGSGHPPGGGQTGDDSGASPVGSVAEEVARLIEMLSATGGPWARPTGADAPSGGATGAATDGGTGPGASARGAEAGPEQTQSGTCTCGGTTPPACRLCPVCQLIAFVSAVSPETIERAADIVDLAATALRDLAATQRARRPAPEEAATPKDREEEHP